MNPESLEQWSQYASRGDTATYGQSQGSIVPHASIMSAAYRLYQQGKVLLVQKRTGSRQNEDGRFNYIAVKV